MKLNFKYLTNYFLSRLCWPTKFLVIWIITLDGFKAKFVFLNSKKILQKYEHLLGDYHPTFVKVDCLVIFSTKYLSAHTCKHAFCKRFLNYSFYSILDINDFSIHKPLIKYVSVVIFPLLVHIQPVLLLFWKKNYKEFAIHPFQVFSYTLWDNVSVVSFILFLWHFISISCFHPTSVGNIMSIARCRVFIFMIP